MDDFNKIQQKLHAFIRKYYLNELLKGISLFLALWLVYFLMILLIEYLFWLSPTPRSILFWTFILISFALFLKFILYPLSQLFKISKGLNLLEASKIVGTHFPEVNDKLLNVLQLKDSGEQSDLLLAGIAQKSKQLSPVPFSKAVDYRSGLKYLKYAAFPVIIILAVIFTGNFSVFSHSYERVVHYNTAYAPPAPFSFVLPHNFQVEEGKDFTLQVTTVGKMVPENISINYNGENYFLKPVSPNHFEYTFNAIKNDISFNLNSNEIHSVEYQIHVIRVPRLTNFAMKLNYPSYTGKKDEIIEGTGNAVLPEGTVVSWKLNTSATKKVTFYEADTSLAFEQNLNLFTLSKPVYSNLLYTIKTSNSEVKNYEKLDYSLEVVKDQFPQIEVKMKRDSINTETLYFQGKTSDDYAVTTVNLVYYKLDDENNKTRVKIPIQPGSYSNFLKVFPGEINLEKGADYQLYFEVFDNDAIHGSKSARSEIFDFRKKSDNEVEEQAIQEQGESIKEMGENLEKMDFSQEKLKEFSLDEKQKQALSFNDRKKLDDFLARQKAQEEMMKNYSEKLKKSLQEDKNPVSDTYKNQLNERLQQNEERLKENEKLLKELEEYSNKINKEELNEKLDKLAKQNTSRQKSLEQLLELTKRYYVNRKTQKLANDLENLSQKQENLPQKDSLNTAPEQEKVTDEFKELRKQLDELEQENESLKKPMDLQRDPDAEQDIQKEQEEAQKGLQQNSKEKAKNNQKSAAKKMKELSQKMKSAQMMAQGQQLNANIDGMRKILDNLLVFSFEQEGLMKDFRNIRINNPSYAGNLKKQQVLKENFEHIDDSIYSLALENPLISDKITSTITNIEFDINKALERLSQNELPQGTASQQYVMTGTNELANMLDNVLSNMQEMANPSQGQGAGKGGLQLPDIIQSQEELNKQMQQGLDKQEGEKRGEGEKKGEDGQSKTGEQGEKEELSGKLYEIYKQQQELRMQLEDKLQKEGLEPAKVPLAQEMQKVEQEILDKGYNQETIRRLNNIKERMLKLRDAMQTQDSDNKRVSETNQKEYTNKAQAQLNKAKEYFNSTEILNRQTLPLRQNYKSKVREYFEGRSD